MARWFILLPNLLVVFVLVGSVLFQNKKVLLEMVILEFTKNVKTSSTFVIANHP